MFCNLIIRFHPASLGYLSLEEPAKQATKQSRARRVPYPTRSKIPRLAKPSRVLFSKMPSVLPEGAECTYRHGAAREGIRTSQKLIIFYSKLIADLLRMIVRGHCLPGGNRRQCRSYNG